MQSPSIINDALAPIFQSTYNFEVHSKDAIEKFTLGLMQGELTHARIECASNEAIALQESSVSMFSTTHASITIRENDSLAPSTYQFSLKNSVVEHQFIATVAGTGKVEIVSIDESQVSFFGDCHAIILYCDDDATQGILKTIQHSNTFKNFQACHGSRSFVIIESAQVLDDLVISAIVKSCDVTAIRLIKPMV